MISRHNVIIVIFKHLPVGFGRNHRCGFYGRDTRQEAGGVKGLVGNDSTEVLHTFNEIFCLGDDMSLSARQAEAGEMTRPSTAA
jgi:hypothetical protein